MAVRLGFLFLLLLIPTAAWANIYVPSFVEMVSSPLVWSIYVVTMVITLPVIMLIGYVETRAVRMFVADGGFWKVFWQLCILNAITSLIRLPFTGPRIVWPGLPVSYLLTIPAEALLIWLFLRKLLSVKSAGAAVVISARMNTASYALLGLAMLAMFYIPVIGVEHPEVGRRAAGRLVISPKSGARTIDLATRKFVVGSADSDAIGGPAECSAADGRGGMVRVIAGESAGIDKPFDASIVRSRIVGGQWVDTRIGQVRKVQAVVAMSGDGSLLVCKRAGKWIVLRSDGNLFGELPERLSNLFSAAEFSPDRRNLLVTTSWEVPAGGAMHSYDWQDVIVDLETRKTERLDGISHAVFSPDGSRLAWKGEGGIGIYDLQQGSRRVIPIRGSIAGSVAWSPDGRLIAYIGSVNTFTANNWWPDVRVVDVQSGKSSTVFRSIYTVGVPGDLLWLR